MNTCKDCRFWDKRHAKQADGLCRRKAPSPNIGNREACWPTTTDIDWCGEFQPLPVKQKTEADLAVPGQAP